MSAISIAKIQDIDNPTEIKEAFSQILAAMKPKMAIPPAATILVKVNLCYIKGPETGVTVDPLLAKYYVEWLLNNFDIKEIIIAESDATHLSADIAFKVLGWNQTFASVPKTRLLNLSHDEIITVELNGHHFQKINMSKTYMEADYLVSFAKLKTHVPQRITCTMKNLFGALPEKIKCIYHPYLNEVIYDLTKVRPPDFCIIDGIIAHEGMGPVDGVPRPMGLIIVGDNAIATDHACAQIIGVNPQHVPHLKFAMNNGLGSTNYINLGYPITEIKESFSFPPWWRQIYFDMRERRSKSS